jgi:hypothetical protein
VYEALACNQLEAARVLVEMAAPEDLALSWPAFAALGQRQSEEGMFEALKGERSSVKHPPQQLTPVLEAAIQHGHAQVARMLRFCGATCSLDDATQPQQAEAVPGAAPAGGLHPIN